MEPMTLIELCNFISENIDAIYIREQVNGVWGNYKLSQLPTELAVQHTLRFIRENRQPHLADVRGEGAGPGE